MILKQTHSLHAANFFLPRGRRPLNMLIAIRISSTIKRRICLAESGAAFPQFVQLFTFTFNDIGVFGQQTLILIVVISCQPIYSLKDQ